MHLQMRRPQVECEAARASVHLGGEAGGGIGDFGRAARLGLRGWGRAAAPQPPIGSWAAAPQPPIGSWAAECVARPGA